MNNLYFVLYWKGIEMKAYKSMFYNFGNIMCLKGVKSYKKTTLQLYYIYVIMLLLFSMESDCYARNKSFIKWAQMLLSYTSKSTVEVESTMKTIILFLLLTVAFGAPGNGKSREMKKREMRSLGKSLLFTYFLIIFTITFCIWNISINLC